MLTSQMRYRWLVNYRDGRGQLRQTIVDSTSRHDAILRAQLAHPAGRDFAAPTKLSARPL